ncbi:hypothetical protein M8864_32490 [Pseudomonas aeruginosa]|uniref:hypothetical protein n=1 Tax=Pseudomonas aeruginosa TaxID=287 RepID=UPI00202167E8|nr:hypothetical protein [Pseudomonas aeruginosa]MCL8047417.1 hypothetical protein [Pseudomonas aeruginosa]
MVGYLATAEHPKHGQPHKAFNYFKDQHDAQVAHWRERGCTVTEDRLMTVSQHERIVEARWNRAMDLLLDHVSRISEKFKAERDAALARVAELEKELAMARDAASKGDAARHAACGMEMDIQELKAKLAELEKQEPLLHINPLVVDELLGRAKRSPGGLTWSKGRCGSWTLPLYAAPVAQAQHSVPEISGIGRDAEHPRAVVLYLRNEPSEEDMRAIQNFLRAMPADVPAKTQHSVQEGYALVPVRETEAMHDAVMALLYKGVARTDTQKLLDAYIAAAPGKEGA